MRKFDRTCKLKDIGKGPIKTCEWKGDLYITEVGVKHAERFIKNAKYDDDTEIICSICKNKDFHGMVYDVTTFKDNSIYKLFVCRDCLKKMKQKGSKPKLVYTAFETKR